MIRYIYGAEEDRMDEDSPGPFSVKGWARYMVKDGNWADAIIPKLLASIWACKVSIFCIISGASISYRHNGLFNDAHIVLAFNDDIQEGHYSSVLKVGADKEFVHRKCEDVKETRLFERDVDREERKERAKAIPRPERDSTGMYHRVIIVLSSCYHRAPYNLHVLHLGLPYRILVSSRYHRVIILLSSCRNLLNCVISGMRENREWMMVRRKTLKDMARDVKTLQNVKEDIKMGEGAAAAPAATAGPSGVVPPPLEIRSVRDIEKDIQVPKEGDTVCEKCSLSFASTSKLIHHIAVMHENKKAFHCLQCNKYFASREGWRTHMKGHEETAKIKCKYWNDETNPCKDTFTTKRAENRHYFNKHSPPANSKCRFKCGKMFSRDQYRNAHEAICKKNKNPNKIPCTMCACEPFKVLRDWQKHCRTVHDWN